MPRKDPDADVARERGAGERQADGLTDRARCLSDQILVTVATFCAVCGVVSVMSVACGVCGSDRLPPRKKERTHFSHRPRRRHQRLARSGCGGGRIRFRRRRPRRTRHSRRRGPHGRNRIPDNWWAAVNRRCGPSLVVPARAGLVDRRGRPVRPDARRGAARRARRGAAAVDHLVRSAHQRRVPVAGRARSARAGCSSSPRTRRSRTSR